MEALGVPVTWDRTEREIARMGQKEMEGREERIFK
jgi:hypothetical protein